MATGRPRIPCFAALATFGVPAKKWRTRADLVSQLQIAKVHIESDPEASVASAARAATMNPEHFQRTFREAYSKSPREFIAARRLERAFCALAETDLPVWKVALDVGYRDASAFSRAFRRAYGMTPTQARTQDSRILHSSGPIVKAE